VALDERDPNYEEPADVGTDAAAEREEKKPLFGVRIRNLTETVSKDSLKDLCTPYGEVAKIYLPRRAPKGKNRGFAFVHFLSQESADEAIKGLNGKDVEGKQLSVEVAAPRPTKAALRAREAEREAKEDRIPWDESKKLDSTGKELCLNFRNSNSCNYGGECKYSHEPGEPIGYPPRVRNRRKPRQESAEAVPAASAEESKASNGVKSARRGRSPGKPKMCSNWKTDGNCQYGDECRFRHGVDDSRDIVQPKETSHEQADDATGAPEARRGRGRGRGRRGRGRGRGRGRSRRGGGDGGAEPAETSEE